MPIVNTNKVRQGRHIMVHLGDGQYVAWSAIVDGPIVFAMTRDECIELMTEANLMDYGGETRILQDRIKRLDLFGTTEMGLHGRPSAEKTIRGNHAGPNGEQLTFAALKRRYGTSEGYDNFELQDGDVIPWED
jgi:hypothetical protein